MSTSVSDFLLKSSSELEIEVYLFHVTKNTLKPTGSTKRVEVKKHSREIWRQGKDFYYFVIQHCSKDPS